jgi:hypothetical protein
VQLEWLAVGFPTRERSLLHGADVGLFVAPPHEAGLSALTIETSRMPHPGVITVPLTDGPSVVTRLVWRSDDENPLLRCLVDLASDMTCDRRGR